jgi:hypothetical protein
MLFLLPLAYFSFFLLLIQKHKFFLSDGLSRKANVSVFALKTIVGVLVWLLYQYYYKGGDILVFFEDGKRLHRFFYQNPVSWLGAILGQTEITQRLAVWNTPYEFVIYNDARTMSVLHMLIRFVSMGNLYVHIVFFAFISSVGFVAIYKTFISYFLDKKRMYFFVVFLLPSVLFWSSAALKESVLFFAIGAFLYTTNCGNGTAQNARKLSMVFLSVVLFLFIKFYVLLALLPAVMANFLQQKLSQKTGIEMKYLFAFVTLLLGAIVLNTINKDYNILQLITDKQTRAMSEARGGVFLESGNKFICIDYDKQEQHLLKNNDSGYFIKQGANFMMWENNNLYDTIFVENNPKLIHANLLYKIAPAKTKIDLQRLKPNANSLFCNVPNALFNAFFQPLPNITLSKLQLMASLENVIFIVFAIVVLLFFRKKKVDKKLLYFLLSFTLILIILVGLTTPAVGAIVRYRIPASPFLMLAVLHIFDNKKAAKMFPRLSKIILG